PGEVRQRRIPVSQPGANEPPARVGRAPPRLQAQETVEVPEGLGPSPRPRASVGFLAMPAELLCRRLLRPGRPQPHRPVLTPRGREWSPLPPEAGHSRTHPSRPAEASCRPSGLKARLSTEGGCPGNDYQLKFVIDTPEDVADVERYLSEFPHITADRVHLMPQ